MESNEKAMSNDFLKPILSATAPAKVGKKYNPAENDPASIAAWKSLNPKIRDKYSVITINTP